MFHRAHPPGNFLPENVFRTLPGSAPEPARRIPSEAGAARDSEWISGTNHFTATLASTTKAVFTDRGPPDEAGAVAELPAGKATLPIFRGGEHFLGRHACGFDQNGFHLALQRSVVALRLALQSFHQYVVQVTYQDLGHRILRTKKIAL